MYYSKIKPMNRIDVFRNRNSAQLSLLELNAIYGGQEYLENELINFNDDLEQICATAPVLPGGAIISALTPVVPGGAIIS